jgi:miniconductance mechanosensitive channel
MSETNTRRIKNPLSLISNPSNFWMMKFWKLLKINLIHDYLVDKKKRLILRKGALENSEEIINGQQLTNIGTFRIYALNYLKNNPNIDQEGT